MCRLMTTVLFPVVASWKAWPYRGASGDLVEGRVDQAQVAAGHPLTSVLVLGLVLRSPDRGSRRGDVCGGLIRSAAAREGGTVLDQQHPGMSREEPDAQPRPGPDRLPVDHQCRPVSLIRCVYDLGGTGRHARR